MYFMNLSEGGTERLHTATVYMKQMYSTHLLYLCLKQLNCKMLPPSSFFLCVYMMKLCKECFILFVYLHLACPANYSRLHYFVGFNLC